MLHFIKHSGCNVLVRWSCKDKLGLVCIFVFVFALVLAFVFVFVLYLYLYFISFGISLCNLWQVSHLEAELGW